MADGTMATSSDLQQPIVYCSPLQRAVGVEELLTIVQSEDSKFDGQHLPDTYVMKISLYDIST